MFYVPREIAQHFTKKRKKTALRHTKEASPDRNPLRSIIFEPKAQTGKTSQLKQTAGHFVRRLERNSRTPASLTMISKKTEKKRRAQKRKNRKRRKRKEKGKEKREQRGEKREKRRDEKREEKR